MKFVRSTQSGLAHVISEWSGPILWTTCGEVIDMGTTTVMINEQEKVSAAPGGVCSDCLKVEAREAYIAGASR